MIKQKSEPCEEEKDINDIFSELLCAEEHLIQKGYEEGLERGSKEGNTEAYHLGYHRGAEIGAELGFYAGIAETYLEVYLNHTDSSASKVVTILENIKSLVDGFPTTNVDDVDIIALVDQIRAKYKKACALLKINAVYPERDELSF